MWSVKLCANRYYPCVMWVCGHLSVLKLETKQRNTIVKKALNISLSSKGLKEDEYFPAEIIWPRCTIKLLQVSLSKISSKLNNYSLIFTKLLGENFIYISNQWNCVYFFFLAELLLARQKEHNTRDKSETSNLSYKSKKANKPQSWQRINVKFKLHGRGYFYLPTLLLSVLSSWCPSAWLDYAEVMPWSSGQPAAEASSQPFPCHHCRPLPHHASNNMEQNIEREKLEPTEAHWLTVTDSSCQNGLLQGWYVR